MKNKNKLRKAFLITFFFLQVAGITAARFTETRYFCWAPYDQISFYEIHAVVNGNFLNNTEIEKRYRLKKEGRENRSIHNVISVVREYETTRGDKDISTIEISFVKNGHSKKTWVWPDDEIIQ